MKVLVACEESQVVCSAFRAKGHEAYSCDLQPCSGGHPEWHIQGDVLHVLNASCGFYTQDGFYHYVDDVWDLVIAHPPCTYISKAGARHLYKQAGCLDPDRYRLGLDACSFFMMFLLYCDSPRICIENPTPLKVFDLPRPNQIIQPYQFGHPYSKRTCLWLKGLPFLEFTNVLHEFTPYCPSNTSRYSKGCKGSKGVARSSKLRSRTFEGIAAAMADQWG